MPTPKLGPVIVITVLPVTGPSDGLRVATASSGAIQSISTSTRAQFASETESGILSLISMRRLVGEVTCKVVEVDDLLGKLLLVEAQTHLSRPPKSTTTTRLSGTNCTETAGAAI
eukprot:1820683-Rhodomonas_salina.4